MFIVALFTRAKTWKRPRCEIGGLVDKDNTVCVCVYNGTSCGRKRKKTLPFATTWRSLKDVMLSEVGERKAATA